MTLGELILKIKADDTELTKSLSGIMNKVKSFAGATIAGLSLGKIFKDGITSAIEFEKTISKLNAVLRSTGGVSGMTAESIQETAKSLSDITTFGKNAIIQAETILLTFTKIGSDVFPRAAAATLDLAKFMGIDAASAARTLGLALQEPEMATRALRSANIILTDSQKDFLKQLADSGQYVKAQTYILDLLTKSIGGQAQAATKTYAGQLEILDKNYKSIAKNIGELVVPMLNEFTTALNESLSSINNYITAQKSLSDTTENLNKLKDTIKEVTKAANQLGMTNKQFLEFARNLKDPNAFGGLGQIFIELARDYDNYTKTVGGAKTKIDYGFNLKAAEEARKKETDLMNLQVMRDFEIYQEREKANQDYYDKIISNTQLAFSTMAGIVNQFGAIASQVNTNIGIEFDNRQHREMEAIQEQYDAEKLVIENSLMTKKQKDKALEALDQKRARDEKKAMEKLEKDKRKAAREAVAYQKAIAIAQATTNIAQGITAVWSTAGVYGVFGTAWAAAMTALIASLGATQIALIAAQPLPALAKGGVFEGPAIVGEKGKEVAFPLEGAEGKSALAEMAAALGDYFGMEKDERATTSQASQKAARPIVLSLDGNVLARWTSDQIENGNVIVTSRNYQ